ncbi:Glycosyl transferase family 2 [Frankineae bacterium MT45]|nr:Glycosyl transferase family 2 [Frankineae bacterium MT45]
MSTLGPDRATNAVSVVIPCYSDERWSSILDAVVSVQKQLTPAEKIVVAVDHNPSLAVRLREALPEVTVVDNNGGIRGASATRNAGAADTTTPLIAFLDDDEVAMPEWLGTLIAPFSDPEVVGTGGRYEPIWETEKPNWFPDVFAWVIGGHYEGMPETVSRVRNVWAGNMAVRATEFRAVGGFLASFGKLAASSQPEDTSLCISMHRYSGGHWMYVPDAVIHHAVPRERSTFSFFVRRCYSEGHGKLLLRANLPTQDDDETLSEERLYLIRVLPRGVLHELRDTSRAFSRVCAMLAGVTAAALGASVAIGQRAFRVRKNRRETSHKIL